MRDVLAQIFSRIRIKHLNLTFLAFTTQFESNEMGSPQQQFLDSFCN